VKVNLENDQDPYLVTKENFDLAVRVMKIGGPLSEDMIKNRARYFKFEITTEYFAMKKMGNISIPDIRNA
jgi:hypothetical protein